MGVLCMLLALQSAAALLVSPLASRVAQPARVSAVQMKHKDYFTRLARSEAGRLRLCVSRSNKHIYAQVVDDSEGKIVAAASTMEKEVAEEKGNNCEAATGVGKR